MTTPPTGPDPRTGDPNAGAPQPWPPQQPTPQGQWPPPAGQWPPQPQGQWPPQPGQPQQPQPGQPQQPWAGTAPQAQPLGQPQPAMPSQPGPGGPGGTAPAPKRNFFARHKVLTVLGAIVVLIVVIAIGANMGGGSTQTGATASQPAASAASGAAAAPSQDADPGDAKPSQAAGIGTPVTDDGFSVTVTKVRTGVTKLGEEPISVTPQGQFVLVDLTATNTGDKAEYFFGSELTLIDTKGREHSPDGGAQVYLGDMKAFLGEVNPGNTVTGSVVFDLPADAVPASIRLPGSLLGDGATISLT